MKLPTIYKKVFTMLATNEEIRPNGDGGELPRTNAERFLASNFRLTKDDVRDMFDELESKGLLEKDKMTITLSGLKKLTEGDR